MGKNTVLFTGYFESRLKGSLTKTDEYRYPVYKVPDDAIAVNLGKFGKVKSEQLIGRVKNGELVPYYSRGEIENQGSLTGRGLELAWVDDRVDLFFMHTQGSGKIELTDGRLLQIGYALRNGRPFQSVSPYLLKMGKITPQENSYKEIKKYLKEHPDELSEILGYNESYSFFRIVERVPSAQSKRSDAGTFDRHRSGSLSEGGACVHTATQTGPGQGRKRRILDPLFPFRRQPGCRAARSRGRGASISSAAAAARRRCWPEA